MATREPDLVKRVVESLAGDADAFAAAVEREATELIAAIDDGVFDNPQAIVGCEQELYGVDAETAALFRFPRRTLEQVDLEAELGLHNAETHTNPQPLNRFGLAAQESELSARLTAAVDACATEGIRPVSDGLWTVPPNGETALAYLSDSVDLDGIRVATNMSKSVRYHALSNASVTGYRPRMELSAPHVHHSFDTVIPESLICSIQPHYQVPVTADLPTYFRYALRVAGPLLALGVNSPLFPPDLYEDVPAETVLEDAHHGNRIGVFESVMNPASDHDPKVAFPEDQGTVEEIIKDIVADHTVVPRDIKDAGRFDDRFKHIRHKHGSYWRWVRPVFDGPTRSTANARIEFRPIGAQPTLRDGVCFLAIFAGLLEALPTAEHPVGRMDWETARKNFYGAARDGLGAEMTWVTADGERTTDREVLYDELFEAARDGLRARGLDARTVHRYVGPLQERADRGVSPARWRLDRVRERVQAGEDLESAVRAAQRTYVDRQADTLVEGTFTDWLG
jgi:hypothetical protein